MKRLIPTLLTLALLPALLSACSSAPASSTSPVPTPFEPSASDGPLADDLLDNPDGEPSLALPPAQPAAAPTHHEEPAESHHVEPEPSHHPDPEETHHVEPEPSHHPEPEETHHPEPAEPSHHPEPTHHGDSHHSAPESSLSLPADGGASLGSPDLQAFYDELIFDDPDFNATAELFGEYLDVYYPGLSAIPARQLVVYQPMMSAVVCEIALVEVADNADIMAVIELFQARIADQVGTEDEPGKAWYPASIESWQNNSRIVSHGRYIMLIAYDKCDDVVAAFDALF